MISSLSTNNSGSTVDGRRERERERGMEREEKERKVHVQQEGVHVKSN